MPTSSASVSSKNTRRGRPASVAVPNSSSVYDTSGLSRTGEPYRVPSIPTYTSHPRTRPAHTCAAGRSAAGKSAMSTITCPAAETALSAAATYDIAFGKSRSSEVCDRNTRHPPPSPGPFKPANRVTPSTSNTLEPAGHPGQRARTCWPGAVPPPPSLCVSSERPRPAPPERNPYQDGLNGRQPGSHDL